MGWMVGALCGFALAAAATLAPLPTVITIAVAAAVGWRIEGALSPDDPDSLLLKEPRTRAELDREARRHFTRGMAHLFVHVAEADGEMTRPEAAAIRTFFADTLEFDAADLEGVRLALHEAREEPLPLEGEIRFAREGLSEAECALLLQGLWRTAQANGAAAEPARVILRRVAEGFGLDPESAARRAARRAAHAPPPRPAPRPAPPRERPAEPTPRPTPEPEPPEAEPAEGEASDLAVLGLPPGSNWAAVKSAWRALVQLHHPDRVARLGAGAVRSAENTLANINAAYERLKHLEQRS